MPDDQYRRSESYSRTLTVWRDRTNATLYQRDPTACWYAMGRAVMQELPVEEIMKLQWSVSEALWNTVRVPGQTFSFIHNGLPVHATILVGSTQSALVAKLPKGTATTGFRIGLELPYMIRPRPPTTTILGPIRRTGSNSFRIQAPLNAIPMPYMAVVYLGGRSGHPVFTCEMQRPEDAQGSIYGIVSVTPVEDNGTTTVSLRSATVGSYHEEWTQLISWKSNASLCLPLHGVPTQHLALGSINLLNGAVLTGYTYKWPYPTDQSGESWLLVPTVANLPTLSPITLPMSVWFLRAAAITGSFVDGQPDPKVDDYGLLDGDRVLELDPMTEEPIMLWEWDSPTMTFSSTPLEPDHQLVVVEGGSTHKHKVWWREGGQPCCCFTLKIQTQTHTHTIHSLDQTAECDQQQQTIQSYRVAARVRREVNLDNTDVDVDLTAAALTGVATAVTHAFVLLVRASNGLYAPTPNAVTTNLYTYPGWTFPVVTADGTDRLNPTGLTDGLIVSCHLGKIPVTSCVLPMLNFFYWLKCENATDQKNEKGTQMKRPKKLPNNYQKNHQIRREGGAHTENIYKRTIWYSDHSMNNTKTKTKIRN